MARRTSTRRRKGTRTSGAGKRTRRTWSRDVARRSDALDLESGVFKLSPREMARSLKRSADRSTRRKSTPFRSAMSMLTFYENRAGKTLSPSRKRTIRDAKQELRRLYGREPARG
jgi:hypothetical protein